MTNTGTQENLFYRYLLGELPEAEQTALEEAFFADDEKFAQVWEAENDLVDRYVRGRLTRRERASFERHYLQSARHRERVAAARLLLQAADAAAERPVTASASWWANLKEFFSAPSLAFGAALASVLLALGAVWLFSERTRLSNQVAQLNSERQAQQQRAQELARQTQALEQQLAAQRERDAQLDAELARLRAEQRRLEAQSAAPGNTPPTVLSFVLTPFVRGEETRALTIPRGAQQVRLQMKSESDDYPGYQASLSAVDGAQVWQGPARKARSATTVAVTVPASKLAAGDYFLTLTGRTADGATEEINRYYFRVSKK
jgi:hypothetical protein